MPYAILAYPLATAAFPKLSQLGEDGVSEAFQATCAWATRRVLAAALVGAALLAAAAPLAQAFFDVLTPVPGMGRALFIIAPALVGFALLYHGQRVLYAVMATRSAWQVGVAAWVSVALAAVVATRLFTAGGHASQPAASWTVINPSGWSAGEQALAGIAVGHTVGMLVAAGGVGIAIYRQVGAAGLTGVGGNLWRLSLALVPASLAAWALIHWLVAGSAGAGMRIAQCVAGGLATVVLLALAVLVTGRRVRADFTSSPAVDRAP